MIPGLSIKRGQWLALTLLVAGQVSAQTESCYYWSTPHGTLTQPRSDPQTSCDEGGAENGSYQCAHQFTCTSNFKIGKLQRGSLATHDASYSCDNVSSVSGSPEGCAENPGLCGPKPPQHWADTTEQPASQAQPPLSCSYWIEAKPSQGKPRDPVGDPIDPASGSVNKAVQDVTLTGIARSLMFERFYSSADTAGTDMGPGWRHSYDRSIVVIHSLGYPREYPGQSPWVSALYSDAASACVQGFAAIQSSVPGWLTATASYENQVCVLSSSSGPIDTVPLFTNPIVPLPIPPWQYDVIRDDGQKLRFRLHNGVFEGPPGVSPRLAQTAAGFTVTDDDDSVETYNASGVLTSITHRAGVVQTLAYDNDGLLSSVTDSFGNALTFTRNVQGSIASVAVSGGGTVAYGYDARLRLATVTNMDATTRTYGYTDTRFSNALTSETDEYGIQLTSWTYDAQERAVSSQQAGGANSASLVYNADGAVTVTDTLGALRTFGFTRIGDENRSASISGSQCPGCVDQAGTTYDSAGWVASRTDYNGNLTCFKNDPVRGLELARLEGLAPGGSCPTDIAAYTPASGSAERKVVTTWSAAFRLPVEIVAPTRTTSIGYDGTGNPLTVSITDTTANPNTSRVWTFSYDNNGRVLTAKGPRSDVDTTTTYTYYSCSTGGACGQLHTVTDPMGNVTTYNTYSAYGQPLTVTDPNGVMTTLTYDARQRLISSTVAGETTAFSYYPTGKLKTITRPDNSFLHFSYDDAHRLTGIKDGIGNQIRYTLDSQGNRLTSSTYDPMSVLATASSAVYNTLGQLSQWIGAAGTTGVTTTYAYDANGNQNSINAPLTRNAAMTFDALNRMLQITDPASGLTKLEYDSNDNVTKVTDPAGQVTSYQFNGFGEVLQQLSPATGTSVKVYDPSGNVRQQRMLEMQPAISRTTRIIA
ncbi:MAG: DUF6531 domain-containing protein [Steroidobacteraceae bacterium]